MAGLRRGLAAVVVAFGLLGGCSGGSPEGQTIRRGADLTFHEGLPHPMEEAAAFAAEKEAKPTVELHGFLFYRQGLDLKPGDEAEVRAVLGDARSYEADSGEKKCGGFHPDYAVGWSAGGEAYACLVCFGCGEFRLYGPAGEAKYDIARAARGRLRAVLGSNRRSRPPHDSLGP